MCMSKYLRAANKGKLTHRNSVALLPQFQAILNKLTTETDRRALAKCFKGLEKLHWEKVKMITSDPMQAMPLSEYMKRCELAQGRPEPNAEALVRLERVLAMDAHEHEEEKNRLVKQFVENSRQLSSAYIDALHELDEIYLARFHTRIGDWLDGISQYTIQEANDHMVKRHETADLFDRKLAELITELLSTNIPTSIFLEAKELFDETLSRVNRQ